MFPDKRNKKYSLLKQQQGHDSSQKRSGGAALLVKKADHQKEEYKLNEKMATTSIGSFTNNSRVEQPKILIKNKDRESSSQQPQISHILSKVTLDTNALSVTGTSEKSFLPTSTTDPISNTINFDGNTSQNLTYINTMQSDEITQQHQSITNQNNAVKELTSSSSYSAWSSTNNAMINDSVLSINQNQQKEIGLPSTATTNMDMNISIVPPPSAQLPSSIPSSSPQMDKSTTLLYDITSNINKNNQINYQAFEHLLEKNVDFFVIGVIGRQGVGKSTMLNLLMDTSNSSMATPFNTNIFRTRSNSKLKFSTLPATDGIQMFITKERTILLDCTPILLNPHKTEHTVNELNDFKLIIFLMNICHLLIVVQENTIELNFLRMLRCAEMMKINLDKEANVEFFPYILFIKNNAKAIDFKDDVKKRINQYYKLLFNKTKLKIFPPQYNGMQPKNQHINIVYVPTIINTTSNNNHYNGCPEKQTILSDYYQRVFMTPRNQFYTVPLGFFTEKNWSQLVVNVWESFTTNYFLNIYETFKEKDWYSSH